MQRFPRLCVESAGDQWSPLQRFAQDSEVSTNPRYRPLLPGERAPRSTRAFALAQYDAFVRIVSPTTLRARLGIYHTRHSEWSGVAAESNP